MAIDETLARVDALVAAGDVAGARARLRNLVMSAPQRLDLRERLAEIYRLEGNRAQAGRWSYLAEERDPREIAAFERAFQRDPVQLMAALMWVGPEGDAATETARRRLRELRSAAEAAAGRTLEWKGPRTDQPQRRTTAADAGCLVVVAAFLASAVVGAITIARWVTDLVSG